MFEIEIAYASPDKQVIISLKVAPGVTVEQALANSNIKEVFPEIDLAKAKVGIFSQPVERDYELRAGDRIEIYRPLIIDPKAARVKRVKPDYLPRRVR